MSFIGQGTYGCVFYPPISCVNDNLDKNGKQEVGKVFYDKPAFQQEKHFHELIQKMDPTFSFTVPFHGTCQINTSKIAYDQRKQCRYLFHPHRYPQIILGYGGNDLFEVMVKKKGNEKFFKKLLKSTLPIIHGLQVMQDHGYIHQDIKVENVLWDGKNMKLIDFSLMTPLHLVYSEDNESILAADYPYFPPEYKLYVKRYKTFDSFWKDYRYSLDFRTVSGAYEDFMQFFVPSYKDDLSVFYRNSRKNYMEYARKMDVFSLGMVLAVLYHWCSMHTKMSPFTTKTKHVIASMLQVNPEKRISLVDVYDVIKKL